MNIDEENVADGGNLVERTELLETPAVTLEDERIPTTQDYEECGEGAVSAFERQLEGQSPAAEHGEEAVIRVFSLLVENGLVQASDL